MLSEDKTYDITYRCTKCEAEDRGSFWLKYGEYGVAEPHFPVLNCYSCGNGRNLSIEQQIRGGAGMFPVQEAAA